MRLQGHVYCDDGRPASHVTLRVYQLGFGGTANRLADDTTDADGSYTLAVEPRASRLRASGPRASEPHADELRTTELRMDELRTEELRTDELRTDELRIGDFRTSAHRELPGAEPAESLPRAGPVPLEIRAVAADGRTEFSLIETVVGGGPADVEVFNLVVPAAVSPLESEYSRLTADLARHLDGGRLADTQERQGQRDVTLLSRLSLWDARLIALRAAAETVSVATGVEPQAVYGLLRVGLPAQPLRLAMVSPRAAGLALQRAVATGLVALTPAQIEAAQAALGRFAAETRRALVGPGALSSHGEMLAACGLSASDQNRLDEILAAHRGVDEDLWSAVRDAGLPVDRIQVTARLGHLTGNNAPLITALSGRIATADQLREALVGQRLYDRSQWVALLTALARESGRGIDDLIPPAFAAPSATERLESYAAHLADMVRTNYSTTVVADLVRTGQFALGATGAESHTDVAMVLDRAAAPDLGFGLGRTPLNAFLREHGPTLFAGMSGERVAETTAHMKRLQRLYQITPSDAAMKVLLDAGFGGARDVTALPYQKYLKRYADMFPSHAEAVRTYAKAQQGTAITYAFFGMAKQMAVPPLAPVLSPAPSVVEEVKDKLIKHYPTMEKLFGSLDFCECDHCLSVLSPAAYLVDILKFVDPNELDWNQEVADWPADHDGTPYPYPNKAEWEAAGKPSPVSPYVALTERRPDLPALALTCENTHTAMPYIDIVNEILEYYVVHGQLAADVAHDTGTATTADLLAEPQHLLPAAYDLLKTAVYPLRLPFDLWLETVRRFSEYFDAPLWRILEALAPTSELYPPPGAYGSAAVALERLGITGAEMAVLTRPDALVNWQSLYGYQPQAVPPATALTELTNAKTLSRRLGVGYRDLVALVRTGFVNPRLETLVTLRKLGVDTEDVLRYVGQPGSTPFTPEEKAAFEATLGPQSVAWAKQAWANGDFGRILVLASEDVDCGFDDTTLQYADGTPADAMVLVLLNLFVRLRRRLGWSIDELDRALGVFLPRSPDPRTAQTLGPALASAVLGLTHLDELTVMLKVGRKGRLQLLPLWSRLDDRRYAELFLTGGSANHDAVFEHPLGQYLSHLSGGAYQPFHYDGTVEDVPSGNVSLTGHLGAVQAALQLSADEVRLVLDDAGIDQATAPLTMQIISVLYRYGLLARLLRLSVADVIFLKAVSAVDPFLPPPDLPVATSDQDHAHATIRFVAAAAAVKESGLSVTDLDYLFRHRFDPVGPHRLAAQPPLGLVRGLAAEIARIRAEHADPADPLTLTDEVVRQKLALVFPPDMVDTFTAMWAGTIEYDEVRVNVVDTDQLDPGSFASVPAITVSYDPVREEQHLRYRGVLSAPVRALVDAALPVGLPAYVGELLDAAQQQAVDFFTRHLLKAFVAGVGEVGFLEPADLDVFFTPAPVSQGADRARRARFAGTFLPYLRDRLIRTLVGQTVAADLGAEPSLTEALLTGPGLIDDPDVAGRELMPAYAAIGDRGLTTSTTAEGGVRLDGYVEVPVTGGYRFSVRCSEANTTVEVRFDHLTDPLLRVATAAGNLEPSAHTELRAGVPYGFTVHIGPTTGEYDVLVRGEQLPKGPLDRLVTYPRATVAKLHRVHLLLAKALRLAAALGLTERELRYLLTHRDDFDSLDLGELPTHAAEDTPERAQTLFVQFRRLVAYVELRHSLGADPDDLVALFDHARRAFPADAIPADAADEVFGDVCARLATITRRDPSTVEDAAKALGSMTTTTSALDGIDVTASGFVDERGVGRVWQVVALASRLGAPPAALKRWADPAPDHPVARDVRDTVKARFTPEQWRRVAQPISDTLRKLRRDALVAQVMHSGGFANTEEMFEHFLVDPGTEPVVQTSRLRLSISSVQLFIQRCLLGLELKVHPSVLNSGHWQWMKRYRVWEANRKIFLWPENWLEPEFRDDKTDLVGELEGNLLQSDVSHDSAEAAFIGYLRRLEQLARLDIRAIHLEERDDASSNTLHVLARTYSTPFKYYYRSYAQQMWTPWVPVSGDLGEHATIAVWRGRVHVFWVNFLTRSETQQPPASDTTKAADVPMKNLAAMKPRLRVQANLSWMAYFQGVWSNPAATGFLGMSDYTFPDPFDTTDLTIHAEMASDGALLVELNGSSGLHRSFRMTSVYARTTLDGASDPDTPYSGAELLGYFVNEVTQEVIPYYGGVGLAVNYFGDLVVKGSKEISAEWVNVVILKTDPPGGYHLVTHPGMLQHFPEGVGRLVAPFFYVDGRHTFFAEPKVVETTIDKGNGLIALNPFAVDSLNLPQKWDQVQVAPQKPVGPGPVEQVSVGAKYSVQEQQDWLTGGQTLVQLGGTSIGGAGGTLINPIGTLEGTS